MKMEIERKFLVILEGGHIPTEIAVAPVKLIQQGSGAEPRNDRR